MKHGTEIVLATLFTTALTVGMVALVVSAYNEKKAKRTVDIRGAADPTRFTFAIMQDGKTIYLEEASSWPNAIDAQAAGELWLAANPVV